MDLLIIPSFLIQCLPRTVSVSLKKGRIICEESLYYFTGTATEL